MAMRGPVILGSIMLCFILSALLVHEGRASSLKEECASRDQASLYYNDSCFLATNAQYSTDSANWGLLHHKCTHFPSKKRHLAFVQNPEHLNLLVQNWVVKPDEKYFVGSRNLNPCGSGQCCPSEDGWSYVDETGQDKGPIDRRLWLRQQPDQGGIGPPESLITLEPSIVLNGVPNLIGFNDVNGLKQDIPLLCEYRDDDPCPEGMERVEHTCVSILKPDKPVDLSIEECEKLGRQHGMKGIIPSIHNDHVNMYLADWARRQIRANRWDQYTHSNPFFQYWPVLIGMTFNQSQWVNSDSTPSDYFRWWSLENRDGLNLFRNPREGYTHVYLLVRTNGDDGYGTFGYWSNIFPDTENIPFMFCQLLPNV